MPLSMRCQKWLCERRRVSACMFMHAHLCAEGEQGAFHADPGEFGFLLTEDLCLNAFFPLAIPHCQDFNIFWKHVICLAISVC